MKSLNQLDRLINKSAWKKESLIIGEEYLNKDFLENYSRFFMSKKTLKEYEGGGYPDWNTFFSNAVPEFQRSNDKWDMNMKISFMENLISGYRTDFIIYTINYKPDNVCKNAKILDGLQRLTAIAQFLEGEFNVFDDFSIEHLSEYWGQSSFYPIFYFKLFDFETLNDAIMFYISINENITHSKLDIDKAKNLLI